MKPKEKSPYYLLRNSILWGVFGAILLSIISSAIFVYMGGSAAIILIAFGIAGGFILIVPISFFCLVFSLRYLYLSYKLSKNKTIKSQKFVNILSIISFIILILFVLFMLRLLLH